MNTDIRIDWRSGMEITPQTFVDMENNISENRLLVRKMIAAKWFGIIPGTKFSVSHEILNGCLVLKQVVCDVLLPTGQVAVVETKAPITLNIPDKEVDGLYLTMEVGDHLVSFEKDGVPHVVNEYHFDFKALSEIGNRQPLLKLVQNNGAWSVYENYVPPVMSVRSSVPLLEKLGELKQAAEKIVHHEHFDLMEDPVLVLTLIDQLETFSPDDSLRELVLLDRHIAVALSYAVMKQKVELSVPNIMDVEPYLNVFKQFLEDIAVAMNDLQPKVVEVVKEPEPEPEPEPEIWCPQI